MKDQKEYQTESSNRIVTIPNLLSFFRLCLIPAFVWMYCVEKEYIWTGILLLVSGATDTVDGLIARRFHMTSDLGKILDPVADKLTQAVMLFCLVTRFPFLLLLLALMIVKECFMAVTGYLVIRRTGSVFGASWHGKVVTWLLYGVMILHVFWYRIPVSVSEILTGICMMMMAISLYLYGRKNLKVLKGKVPEKD